MELLTKQQIEDELVIISILERLVDDIKERSLAVQLISHHNETSGYEKFCNRYNCTEEQAHIFAKLNPYRLGDSRADLAKERKELQYQLDKLLETE